MSTREEMEEEARIERLERVREEARRRWLASLTPEDGHWRDFIDEDVPEEDETDADDE